MQIQTDRNQKELKMHGTYEFPVLVSHERLSNYERNSFMWHWHKELEWTYILEGEIQYQVNDQVYVLKAGDGILCNSNMLHMGRPFREADCHYVSITFHPRLLEGYANSFLSEKYTKWIVENSSIPCIPLSPEISWQAEILHALQRIEALYLMPREDYDFQIYLLLMESWRLACKHIEHSRENQIAGKNIERIKQILTYIHQHFQEKITLEDIAAQVNICSSECCRFFKKHMHESLFDYLLNYRIESSLSLLAKGTFSITEIAVQCGFSSPSYFTKVFREHMGYAPREYQKYAASAAFHSSIIKAEKASE